MKLLDWIRGMFNKNKLIEAPKQEVGISPEEQFRKDMQEKAEFSQEENELMRKEQERKRQIRVASYDVINAMINLDNDDIKRNLKNKLENLQAEQLMRKGRSDLSTEIVLTDIDVETLKYIHFAIQNNPQFSSYLNRMNQTTRDNNIIEVVNRMEQIAKSEAKNWGQVESKAVNFMPNASDIIYQLQKEQQEQQMEH